MIWLILLWCAVGISSLILDLREVIDIRFEDLFMCVLVGALIGPVALLILVVDVVGAKLSADQVIFKKRVK